MVFSSLIFIFAYLPIALAVYFCSPRKYKNSALLLLSLAFYGWGEPIYIAVMLISILSAYLLGYPIAKYREIYPRRAKAFLALSVGINLSLLIFFKYAGFFTDILSRFSIFSRLSMPDSFTLRLFGEEYIIDFLLPIGISFYTFQIISYSVDLYRGKCGLQRSAVNFGAYVTLFPQLVAGPIVRYNEIDEQLLHRRETVDKFASGVRRFCVGLGKKALLGDGAAALYEYYKGAGEIEPTLLGAWLLAICFAFHIYFDFSGYSDMAIGLGKMLGFDFPENFNYPYISKSITEFWRRWHISLSSWFREYVYIPLGGNRRGKPIQYRNIAIVWLLTGLWHGASFNFILWGVYFGVLLMLEKAFLLRFYSKIPSLAVRILICAQICVGWIIFSSATGAECISILGRLVGVGVVRISSPTVLYESLRALPFLSLCTIGSTPLAKKIFERAERKVPYLSAAASMLILFVSVAYIADASFSPFLYFIF